MSWKKISWKPFHIACLLAIPLALFTIYFNLSDKIVDYDANYFSGESIYSYDEDAYWLVVVDLDQLSLSVYKDGILVKTYPCSGGKDETPSPVGEFKIISKESWGEGFGGIWMSLNVPWGTYGIHGTNYSAFVGKKNISHGCIRMLTEDAKELADMVPLETPVQIVQNNRLFVIRYYGDSGSEIWNAQVTLQNLGYYNGELDGKFGAQFREAIIRFQKDNGLKETGSLNQKTYDKILEKSSHE